MAILKVARLGHPILRRPRLEPVDEVEAAAVQELIDDMVETLREHDGAGLAAPQVHLAVQVAVTEVRFSTLYPDTPRVPLTVMVNPVVTPATDEVEEGWEGCLSIPDLHGLVPRPAAIRLDCLDRRGKPVHLAARGFQARAIQHEVDHLQGVVYLDRMRALSSLCYTAEWQKYRLEFRGPTGPRC